MSTEETATATACEQFEDMRKAGMPLFKGMGPVIGRTETGEATMDDFTPEELTGWGYEEHKGSTGTTNGWTRKDGPCDIQFLPERLYINGWFWGGAQYPPGGLPTWHFDDQTSWHGVRPCGGPIFISVDLLHWIGPRGNNHRVDGPAKIFRDGRHTFYIDGTHYTTTDEYVKARDKYLETHPEEQSPGRLTKAAR